MQTNVKPPLVDIVMHIADRPAGLERWINEPWGTLNSMPSIKRRGKIQEKIDDWLAEFWANPGKAKGKFLTRESDGRLTCEAKLAVASLTALSVAWEILSEYRAILDCGLEKQIRLGSFWRDSSKDPGDWTVRQQDMLTILFDPKDGIDAL